MILRTATSSDAERLLIWRNDPATRSNSFTMERVSLASHMRWLAQVLNDPCRELMVAEVKGEAVGTVRLDYAADLCELSWTVAPEQRKRGYGRMMVARAIEQAKCARLIARIKSDNRASQQIVDSLGFTAIAHEERNMVWMLYKAKNEHDA